MQNKFWMVLVSAMYPKMPSVYHATLDEALTEATRLCVKEGKTFYVLEAVKAVKIVNPETEVVEL